MQCRAISNEFECRRGGLTFARFRKRRTEATKRGASPTNENVFTAFDDRPLLDAAKRLATDERRATAALLRALMEIDSRRLYLGEGCASMFAYCTQVLHLADGAA